MFMRHPSSGPVVDLSAVEYGRQIREVSERAFQIVWEPRGWERVEDAPATLAVLAAVAELPAGAPALEADQSGVEAAQAAEAAEAAAAEAARRAVVDAQE